LEHNLLKTHKYKLLKLFVRNTITSSRLERIKVEKKRKQKEMFVEQISSEKKKLMIDQLDYKEVVFDINQSQKQKSKQDAEIDVYNRYLQRQIEKENK